MAQHTNTENKTYNERLFGSGVRGYFHNARFKWLYFSLKKLKITKGSFLEIGCNDGRTLQFLPFEPIKYVGYDADWEGGLNDSIEKYKNTNNHFIKSVEPTSFNPKQEVFDYTLAMETIEHLPLEDVDLYLKKLSAATRYYGFYSVPNEKGVVFFFKHYLKKIFKTSGEQYSLKEVWYALTGNLDKIVRKEHKGFDYDVLIKQLAVYFEVVEVKGIPFGFLPPSLNFTVGIIVKHKNL